MKARIDEFAIILIAGIVFILLFSFFSQLTISGLEVLPNKIDAKIVEGSVKTFEITIFANSSNVSIKAEGAIAPYVSFDTNQLAVFGQQKIKMFFDARAIGNYYGRVIVKTPYRKVFIPVSISVISKEEVESLISEQLVPLGSFHLVYSNQTILLAKKENFEVSSNILSQGIETLWVEISNKTLSELENLWLEIFINETNSKAKLVVEFNDKKIYEDFATGDLKLTLPRHEVLNKNLVKIYSLLPSAFWQTSYYKIREAKVIANLKPRNSITFNITLSNKQVNNFMGFKLEFLIKKNTVKQVFISFNNQLVHASRVPLTAFSKTFTQDLFGNKLFAKNNNWLEIKIEEPGELEATNANLFVYYLG